MSSIYPDLDERLSAELEQHYFSSDDKGRKIDRQKKFRVMNALHRLWNFDELACYGVVFRIEEIRKVILDLMKPEHIRLALKSVEFCSGCCDSVWVGCAIFMFARFDEDLQSQIRKGVLSRGHLPLVVSAFLSEVVITEKEEDLRSALRSIFP